ncbi:MAG: hypothetical protein HKN09_08665 [Saprospiraceae bacterium]|nr:hypothetical protein [Saprospiraceae bacterium]
MKRMSLYVLIGLTISLTQCDILPLTKATELSTAGFIITEDDRDKKFYLQDIEDGSVIELKFFFDSNEDLHFDEFNYVEVKGLFTKAKNVLYVEELHPSTKECNASSIALASALH